MEWYLPSKPDLEKGGRREPKMTNVHGRLALAGLIDSLPQSWTRKRRQAWLRAVVKAADYVVDIEPDSNYEAALAALELMLRPGSAADGIRTASEVLARSRANTQGGTT